MTKQASSFPNANLDGTAIEGMNADGTWDTPPADEGLSTTDTAAGGATGTGQFGTGEFGAGGLAGNRKPVIIPNPNATAPTTPVATANPWDNDSVWIAYRDLKKKFEESGPIWTEKQNAFERLSTSKADADNAAWEKEERDKRIAADAQAVKDVAAAKVTYDAAKGVWDAKLVE